MALVKKRGRKEGRGGGEREGDEKMEREQIAKSEGERTSDAPHVPSVLPPQPMRMRPVPHGVSPQC